MVAAHHLPEPLPHLLGPDEPEPHVIGVGPRLLLHLTVGLPCITNQTSIFSVILMTSMREVTHRSLQTPLSL